MEPCSFLAARVKMIPLYLDHNATTPVLPEVFDAMAECAREAFANPASQHGSGRAARRRLEEAREGIARILGAESSGMSSDQVIFTSGGTEANNLALLGLAPREPSLVVVSAIEHPSVVGAAEELERRGHKVRRLRVDANGVVDLGHLAELLNSRMDPWSVNEVRDPAQTDHESIVQTKTDHGSILRVLVSIMLGNNETGVLQPIAQIARICRGAEALLHTDAVQAVGKIPVDFRALGVDALTLAAHKFHGPRGIGALILRHGVKLEPLLHGGFQQAGLRPGTECTALAVGMYKALELWQAEGTKRTTRLADLRDRFEQQIAAALQGVVVNGVAAPRLPHTSNLAFLGLDRQALFIALDLAGVACSTGSACASGSSEPSPVLLAMQCPSEVVSSSLRFSLGAETTAGEIDEAVARIVKTVNDLRRRK